MLKYTFFLTCVISASVFLVATTYSAFEAGDFTTINTARQYYDIGASNALIAEFQLPDPVIDTIITNGATTAISPGDALSGFVSTTVYHDANADSSYDDGEGVATSDDELLSSTDTVLTDIIGILSTFPATPEETDTDTAVGWVDSGPSANEYDSSENLGTLIRNAESATNGLQVRLFPSDIAYLADSNNANYSVASDNVILEDTDADGYISSGDTVLLTGKASIHQFDGDDNICFDASISANAEYDFGEVIWKDIAGDCSSFTSTTDIILVGGFAPSGTSTEFGTENEVGFMDGDGDNAYDCTRGGNCEGIVYSGSHDTNLTTDGNLTGSATFFDGSGEGTDGVRTVANSWDEASNTLITIVFFEDKTDSGEAKYFYLDADSNADFTSTDPVLESIIEGNALTTGQTWRTFYDNDHYYYDRNGDGQYLVNSTGRDGLILSSDATLNAGALNGSGIDEVLVGESVGGAGSAAWSTFASSEKYHDHDSSGSYADGDDIINDNDNTNLYNADDLTSIQIGDTGSGDIADADLDAIYVYQREGSSCAGSGIDTLLGTDTSTPFLEQAITITKNPYTTNDSVASRTICIYADISDSADVATLWKPQIPANGAVFLSGTVTQSVRLDNSIAIYIAENVVATLTASSRAPEATATYTAQFTQGSDAAPIGSIVYVVFPTGYDVSAASISCTDDGDSITGVDTIFGQIVGIANIDAEVAGGSAISCSVSNVVNPSAEGETEAFLIGTTTGGLAPYSIDDDNTITITTTASTGSNDQIGSDRVTPTFTLDVVSPNGNEIFEMNESILVKWHYTGNTPIPHVNIYASIDGGETYTEVATFADNDGLYVWHTRARSGEMRIKIATTDLAQELYSDQSDATFVILDANGEVPGTPTNIGTPSLEARDTTCLTYPPFNIRAGDYILGQNPDGSVYPAVYYISSDCKRHSFLNEATYYTYQDDFSIVDIVPIMYLAEIPEGNTMPVNPETILIKTPTSPDVYYVIGQTGDISPNLVKIRSEQEARYYFGPTWNESILDIPEPLFNLHAKSDFVMSDVLSGPKTLLNRLNLGR